MSRQKKLLAVLLGLFGLALAFGVATYPKRERVEGGPPPAAARPREVAKPPGGAVQKEEARLPRQEEGPTAETEPEVKRNIFGPLFPVEIPPVPPAPAPVENEPPPEVVAPPPPPFELLGYVKKPQDQIFFLTRANNLFIVRPHEKFGENDQYRIVKVEPESIVLEENGKEKITLPLKKAEQEAEPGGQPFSTFQVPPQGAELPLPEPPSEVETEPEEPGPEDTGEAPAGPEEKETEPEATAPKSPLAPGLIGPENESLNENANNFEEEAAPSR
jgi:hypothetical protein